MKVSCVRLILNTSRPKAIPRVSARFYDFDIERPCSRDFLKLDSPLDKSALHFPRKRIFISRPRTIISPNVTSRCYQAS